MIVNHRTVVRAATADGLSLSPLSSPKRRKVFADHVHIRLAPFMQ
jgi:hypothetical protein